MTIDQLKAQGASQGLMPLTWSVTCNGTGAQGLANRGEPAAQRAAFEQWTRHLGAGAWRETRSGEYICLRATVVPEGESRPSVVLIANIYAPVEKNHGAPPGDFDVRTS